MSGFRELRIRVEAAAGSRPRVWWQQRPSPEGHDESDVGSLQIGLRDGALFIRSAGGPSPDYAGPGSTGWQEVSGGQTTSVDGLRVEIDFADEVPLAVSGSAYSSATTKILLNDRRSVDRRPLPAPEDKMARTRILDTTALRAVLKEGALHPKPREELQHRQPGTLTRFFRVEQKPTARGADDKVEVPVSGRSTGAVKPLSTPRKILVVLLPVAIAAVWLMHMQKVRRMHRPALAPHSAASSAWAPVPASPPTRMGGASETPAPADRASREPTALPSATMTSLPAAQRSKTSQRAAADAIATGAFSDAAPLYEDLARQHPESQVYREVVRILRARNSSP